MLRNIQTLIAFYILLPIISLDIKFELQSAYQASSYQNHWINDGLMATFFFVIGLELKREILVGELADPKQATLPIVAAIGVMVIPVLIYVSINPEGHTLDG